MWSGNPAHRGPALNRYMCGSGCGGQAADPKVVGPRTACCVVAVRIRRLRGRPCDRVGCIGDVQACPRDAWPRAGRRRGCISEAEPCARAPEPGRGRPPTHRDRAGTATEPRPPASLGQQGAQAGHALAQEAETAGSRQGRDSRRGRTQLCGGPAEDGSFLPARAVGDRQQGGHGPASASAAPRAPGRYDACAATASRRA